MRSRAVRGRSTPTGSPNTAWTRRSPSSMPPWTRSVAMPTRSATSCPTPSPCSTPSVVKLAGQRRHREDQAAGPRLPQLRRRRLTPLPTPTTDHARTMLIWEGPVKDRHERHHRHGSEAAAYLCGLLDDDEHDDGMTLASTPA